MALKDLAGGRGGTTQPTICQRVKRKKSDLVRNRGRVRPDRQSRTTGLNHPYTAQKRVKKDKKQADKHLHYIAAD
jgi:hypothetical protein